MAVPRVTRHTGLLPTTGNNVASIAFQPHTSQFINLLLSCNHTFNQERNKISNSWIFWSRFYVIRVHWWGRIAHKLISFTSQARARFGESSIINFKVLFFDWSATDQFVRQHDLFTFLATSLSTALKLKPMLKINLEKLHTKTFTGEH